MSESENSKPTAEPMPCGQCGGCGRCCGKKAVEYVLIDSFVWPPWPDTPDESAE